MLNVVCLKNLEYLERLEHLENLEHLERLEHLEKIPPSRKHQRDKKTRVSYPAGILMGSPCDKGLNTRPH